MSIKCSLFGHSFDESTVEREREEQGSEVVITIREAQTCTRCGETRVVSENKEVTTLETPDDVGVEPLEGTADTETSGSSQPDTAETVGSELDGDSSPPEAASASAGVTDGPTTDQSSDPVERDPSAGVAESPPTDVAQDSGPNASNASDIDDEPPVTDDAEILDDDSDTSDREPGEWPQEADESESQPDTDILTEAESDSDEGDQTDAEFVTDEGETQTNEWPSEDEIDAASEPESAGPGAVTAPDGSYVCRECGFSTPVEQSSLREGDFCPECHRGTLVHTQNAN